MSQPVEPERAASPFTKKDLLIGLLFFIVGFAIYAWTVAPDVLWGDSGEFQVISATGGLAHATGYPVYLAIGKLFSLLPFKTIPYRVDLVSALMGALAATGIYFLTKALGARRAFALIAATIMLLNPLFWWQSIIAEVYAITAAFFVAFLTCAVVWRKTRDTRWLVWGGILGGLCLGLHHTVILTVPAMVLYLVVSKANAREWGKAGLGAGIGIVIALAGYYGMASLDSKTSSINSIKRSATAYGMKTSDFDSPVTQINFLFLAKQWASDVGNLNKDEATRNAGWYGREAPADFGWPATTIAFVGFVGLITSKRNRWPDAVLLGLSWAILFFFILTFNPVDLEVDFIPSFLIIAVLAGLGLQWIQNLFVKLEVEPGEASQDPALNKIEPLIWVDRVVGSCLSLFSLWLLLSAFAFWQKQGSLAAFIGLLLPAALPAGAVLLLVVFAAGLIAASIGFLLSKGWGLGIWGCAASLMGLRFAMVPENNFAAFVFLAVGVYGLLRISGSFYARRWALAAALLVVFGGGMDIVRGASDAIRAGATVFLTGYRRVYPYPVDNPTKAHDYAHAIVDHVEGDALIITEWHYLYPFYYVALFDDDKPGIEVVESSPSGTDGHIVQSMQDFIKESVATRPVYMTQGGAQTPVDLFYSYYFVPVDTGTAYHLYRLQPK